MKLLVSTGMSHGELGRVWGSREASYHHRRTVDLPKWGKPRRRSQATLRGYLIFKLLAHPRMVIVVRETIMHKDDLSELCQKFQSLNYHQGWKEQVFHKKYF